MFPHHDSITILRWCFPSDSARRHLRKFCFFTLAYFVLFFFFFYWTYWAPFCCVDEPWEAFWMPLPVKIQRIPHMAWGYASPWPVLFWSEPERGTRKPNTSSLLKCGRFAVKSKEFSVSAKVNKISGLNFLSFMLLPFNAKSEKNELRKAQIRWDLNKYTLFFTVLFRNSKKVLVANFDSVEEGNTVDGYPLRKCAKTGCLATIICPPY